jgi:hypothetical protein
VASDGTFATMSSDGYVVIGEYSGVYQLSSKVMLIFRESGSHNRTI